MPNIPLISVQKLLGYKNRSVFCGNFRFWGGFKSPCFAIEVGSMEAINM